MTTLRPHRRLFAALLLAAAVALPGCAGDDAGDEVVVPEAPPVEAVEARFGALPLEERLNGVVRAEGQVAVRPEIEAVVAEVRVRSGEAVERGQVLVRLDDRELRDQLRQAEADLRLAQGAAREADARTAEIEAQVTRSRALAAEDLVSPMTLETQEAQLQAAVASAEQAAARVDQARATVAERRTALGKTLVRAPVAGRIGQREVEAGMLVDPSTVLFQLGNLERMRVEIPLTEEMLSDLHAGQSVVISSPNLPAPRRATLSRISPFLESGSFTTIGEIDLANPGGGAAGGDGLGALRPGMFVTVDVLYGESESATLVPNAALWEDPRTGVVGVFVVAPPADGFAPGLADEAVPAELRSVEVIAEGAAASGVTGVEPGQWVVTVGQHLLAGREVPAARVRPTTWERVLALQGLQREDLLRDFLAEQQRVARVRGTEPPTSDEFLLDAETPAAGPASGAGAAGRRPRPDGS
ncbi:MAG TPA: efflux RND transporter periplasmic adaptor subunit [Thermoanaerobaculia bacterium]|nr:efflux RND transporter periplasmic adaptor subunit [Thermoanaerobaculia bacterium]